MAYLANLLSRPLTQLGRPVIDSTGIAGDFDIDLQYDFMTLSRGLAPGAESDLSSLLVTALQEQLGLKLRSGKADVKIFHHR